MKSIGFIAFYDKFQSNLFTCSYESDKYPLVVNCAGIINISKPFTTHNKIGRKDYYLLYITEGSLDVCFPDGMRSCPKGTLIIFPPNIPYKYSLTTEQTMTYYYVHFSGSEVLSILSEYNFELHPMIAAQIPVHNAIEDRFTALFDTFSKTDKLKDRELYLRLDRLFMTLSRQKSNFYFSDSGKLSKSVSYIHSSFEKNIKITDLANMESMSVSAYNALFVKLFGMPPGKYLIMTRMASASSLLADTDIPIKEIGTICGYSDPQFFSKIFKSHIGVSPRDYRNKKRTDRSDDRF